MDSRWREGSQTLSCSVSLQISQERIEGSSQRKRSKEAVEGSGRREWSGEVVEGSGRRKWSKEVVEGRGRTIIGGLPRSREKGL